MKRVINGLLYNMEAALRVAQFDYDGRPSVGEWGFWALYCMPQGAFVLQHHRNVEVRAEPGLEANAVQIVDTYEPLSRAEAHDWVMSGNVELYSDVLGEPPEAREETSPSTTLYLRISISLKERIETKFNSDEHLINDWILHCVEEKLLQEK